MKGDLPQVTGDEVLQPRAEPWESQASGRAPEKLRREEVVFSKL